MNQKTQILEEIRQRGGNLSAVARSLGLDYHALRQRFPQDYAPFKTATGPEPTNIKLLGRENFTQYVIAIKPAGQGWPAKYEAVLADARKKFDAGTHEMFQSRHPDGWVVQYLIPHLVPVPKRTFFSTMIVMK